MIGMCIRELGGCGGGMMEVFCFLQGDSFCAASVVSTLLVCGQDGFCVHHFVLDEFFGHFLFCDFGHDDVFDHVDVFGVERGELVFECFDARREVAIDEPERFYFATVRIGCTHLHVEFRRIRVQLKRSNTHIKCITHKRIRMIPPSRSSST